MLASLFNFLYYPITARISPTAVYGEIQFFAVILFQISVLLMALNVLTIIFTAHGRYKSATNSQYITALSTLFNLTTSALSFIACILLATSTNMLRLSTPLLGAFLVAAILSTVPFTVGIGILQGKLFFIKAGIISVLGPLLKLVASYFFITLGWGACGALLGIAVGQFGAICIASMLGWVKLNELVSLNPLRVKLLKGNFATIIAIGGSIIAVNSLSSFDTFFAKLLMSSTDAGIYAGMATLSKIALFLVSPLMWMCIPIASNQSAASRKRIYILLGIAAVACTLLFIAYTLFASQITFILLGERYSGAIHLLPLATAAMSTLAISAMGNVILSSRIVIKHTVFQCMLVILTFIIALLTLLPLAKPITSIIAAQLAAGIVGVVYYIIVELKWRENGRYKTQTS